MSNDFHGLAVGQVLHERYTILELAAQGGMSTIYRASDSNLPGFWAIKQMTPLQARAEDLSSIRAQFRQEAEILTRLRHPGVPRIIDFFTERDIDYLVMEFVEGECLEHLLDTHRSLSEYDATRIAMALLEILEHLHSHGIIYRDMKPGNVIVTRDGRIVLVDFGISRLFTTGKSTDTVIVGTPGFASPEHYGRGQTDARSDVFSMGATLHQMLTGHDPSDSPFTFTSPAKAQPGLSLGVSEVVMRAVDLLPERRFATAAAMREALASSRKMPPARRELSYPRFVPPQQQAIVYGSGLLGSTMAGLLGATLYDPHALLLVPVSLAAMSGMGVMRGWKLRHTRVVLDDTGLRVVEGATETVLRWEEIREIRVLRTTGANRTLWGEVTVYTSRIDIVTPHHTAQLLPALQGWEELVAWVAYRSGLRLRGGAAHGADEIYAR